MASVTAYIGTAANVSGTGNFDWTSLTNGGADDGTYIECSNGSSFGYSRDLLCTMGANAFSIPAGSRIDGVVVEYGAKLDSGSAGAWVEVLAQLVIAGVRGGQDLRNPTSNRPTTTEANYTHGSSTFRWGIPLTVAAVNASNFGVALAFYRDSTATRVLQLDYVRLTVHYTAGAGDLTYDSELDVCATVFNPMGRTVGEVDRVPFPGLGTPKGVLFMSGLVKPSNRVSETEVTTTADAVRWGFGAAISDSNRSSSVTFVREGTIAVAGGSSTVQRNLRLDRCIDTEVPTYDFTGFGADYLDIDCLTAFGASTVRNGGPTAVALAFTGTGLEIAHLVQNGLGGTQPNTSHIESLSFKPDVLINLSGQEVYPSGGHVVYESVEIGFAVRKPDDSFDQVTAAKWTQAAISGSSPITALSDTECGVRVSTDRIHWHSDRFYLLTYEWVVSDADSVGFLITSTNGESGYDDDGATLLALKLPAGRQAHCCTWTTPTTTGDVTVDGSDFDPPIPFTPDFLLLVWTKAQAVDTTYHDSDNGTSICFSFADARRQACISYRVSQAASNVDASTRVSRQLVSVQHGDGSDAFVGTLTGFVDGGFTANMTAADGTARKGVALAMKFERPEPLGLPAIANLFTGMGG